MFKKKYKGVVFSLSIFLSLLFLFLGIRINNLTTQVRADEPIEISSLEDLDNVRNDLEANYILINDLDFNDLSNYSTYDLGTDTWSGDNLYDLWTTGEGWVPIATSATPFSGVLDAQGNTIANFFMDRPSADYKVGMFGISEGEIRNLYIVGADVTGGDLEEAGILVGLKDEGGIIDNVHIQGNITGGGLTGGLIGVSNRAFISNSSWQGVLENFWGNAGGLVGNALGTVIINCFTSGSVISTGDWGTFVGGLVGSNEDYWVEVGDLPSISYSYSFAEVIGESYVGGLVGSHWGDSALITNSFATGNVLGRDDRVGGFVGDIGSDSVITNSYSTGNVTVEGRTFDVGGFAGRNWGGTIENSYSIGHINALEATEVGGFIGLNHTDSVVENSFWDMESSGMTESDGGEGRTTEEMKDIATFLGAGWDIVTTEVDVNNGYPYLSWQVPGNSPTWYIFEGSEEEENGLENGEEEENGVEEEIEEGEEAEEDGDESTLAEELAETGMNILPILLFSLSVVLLFIVSRRVKSKKI